MQKLIDSGFRLFEAIGFSEGQAEFAVILIAAVVLVLVVLRIIYSFAGDVSAPYKERTLDREEDGDEDMPSRSAAASWSDLAEPCSVEVGRPAFLDDAPPPAPAPAPTVAPAPQVQVAPLMNPDDVAVERFAIEHGLTGPREVVWIRFEREGYTFGADAILFNGKVAKVKIDNDDREVDWRNRGARAHDLLVKWRTISTAATPATTAEGAEV